MSHPSVVYGSTSTAGSRAAPVRNETGWIVEWLGTSTDVHEMRELWAHQKVLVAELQYGNHPDVVLAMGNKTSRPRADLYYLPGSLP